MTTSSREEEIRQDIERTREQLGDTVEALAHKVDVPARVKETVHVKTEEVKQQAQAKAEEVTEQVLQGTEALQAKAAEVAQHAERLIDQGLGKLPPPVATRIEPLIDTAKQRPLPAVAVATGVLLVLRLVLRRLLRRKR
jgi:DNA repair exonuclease SbcCD ATPase subunit